MDNAENQEYLTKQLITYIGNKRNLLNFIGDGVDIVAKKLNKKRIVTFDVFSGSGVVSRYLKKYSEKIITNDLEYYALLINKCYLTNKDDVDYELLNHWFDFFAKNLTNDKLKSGFIHELYSPKNLNDIKSKERCFYSPRNAMYIDTARMLIDSAPLELRHFFLAPLLSEASIHVNTPGIFKGFYKNSQTGIGQFGGTKKDALDRILGNIELTKPIFSNFNSEIEIHNGDSNKIIDIVEEVDLAYIDPPYNQHPYGSNYFMLNLITSYTKPTSISNVSGIPDNWNRSSYNKKIEHMNLLTSWLKK